MVSLLVLTAMVLTGIAPVNAQAHIEEQSEVATSTKTEQLPYTELTVQKAEVLTHCQSVAILDVRTQLEYESGHISGAILIPVLHLEESVGELAKDKDILVYCKNGSSSARASDILVNHGFQRVYNMLGGTTAWIEAGFSLVSEQKIQTDTPSLTADIDALLEDTPVFLFFYADWCHFCHEQLPIVDELEQEYAGKLAFLSINVDETPEYAEVFGVSALPTMVVIYDKNERVYVKREVSGFTEKESLMQSISLEEEQEPDENPLPPEDKGSEVSPTGTNRTATTTCDSCASCQAALSSGLYDEVMLAANILNCGGSCIELTGVDNVVFDGNGHTIDGDNIPAIDGQDAAVTIMGGTGYTIQNCVISEFDAGIYLAGATSCVISNNDISSNAGAGIQLNSADYNDINNNTISDNNYGIYMISNPFSNTINSNTVCGNAAIDIYLDYGSGNSGDNNTCDSVDGWNDDGTTGCTNLCAGSITCNSCSDCSGKLNGSFDNVILAQDINNHAGTCIVFGASNVLFDGGGHIIDGDDSGTDYGILMLNKTGNTIKNCIVTDFSHGIGLSGSSGNTIRDNGVNSNTVTGIWISNSSGNTITFNELFDNDALYSNGIFLHGSDSNTLSCNKVLCSHYGITLDDSHSNTLNLNTVCSNPGPDFQLISGSSGNSGINNHCDAPGSWNDDGTTGCRYTCDSHRCSTCSDGIQNGDEEGVDCGGTYCPPCSQCLTGAKYAPHDTPCQHDWPTSDGPNIGMNTHMSSCNLVEVCNPDLDYIIEDALLCAEYEDYASRFTGYRSSDKIAACDYAHAMAYDSNFEHNFNPTTLKKCLAFYIIQCLGQNAVYIQGYFTGELCCYGDDICPSSCSKWQVDPAAWEMGAQPDFQMGGHNCKYNYVWCYTYDKGWHKYKWGKSGYWNSDDDYGSNSDSRLDTPAHVTINRLSTGTCVDYSFALTTLLRKAGYSRDEVFSVNGVGHGYNLLKFPDEPKWHYVDTVGNGGGGVYGGSGFTSPNYHHCKGTPLSCAIMNNWPTACNQVAGCTWSDGRCTGTPAPNSCAGFQYAGDCDETDGCVWKLGVSYDYCRNLLNGCSNDYYTQSRGRCPTNSMIYGCEWVYGYGSDGVSNNNSTTIPSSTLEVEPAPGYHASSYDSEADGECTELHPCVGNCTQEASVPPLPVDIEVTKELSSQEIEPGDELTTTIHIKNEEPESLNVTVRETFAPGISYNLEAEEGWYDGFHFNYYDWCLEIPASSTESVTFTAAPTSVGYYSFMPTSVFAGGLSYTASSPPFKVVCAPDGICGEGENCLFCPEDCPTGTKDGFCDLAADGINDPDCEYGLDPDYSPRLDTDEDGIMNMLDQCPMTDPADIEAGYVNADGCSCSQLICDDQDPLTIDRCDNAKGSCYHLPDADQDEVPDSEDNCPYHYNPEQLDSDGDGTGDQCELGDIDEDTTLEPETYHIADLEQDGAIKIIDSDVVLDCNGATFYGDGSGYGIYIPDDVTNVTIKNCRLRNYSYGIYVDGSSSNNLLSNTLEENGYGLVLGSSSGNVITNNTASLNMNTGIYLEDSSNNKLSSNNLTSNSNLGVFMHSSSNNELNDNYACHNADSDFYLHDSVGTGYDNTCDNPADWNDTGTTGCSFACEATNNPPNIPGDPSPAHNATAVSMDADLGWSGGDPDTSDNVTYEVLFGTNTTPPLVETIGPFAANQTSLNYTLDQLSPGTTYHWQIIARDNYGITTVGPIWEFTTISFTSYNITLAAGWNLVSLPLIPDNTDIDAVISAANLDSGNFANIVMVYTFNTTAESWMWWNGSPASTLNTMEDGRGYWFYTTAADTLTVHGTEAGHPGADYPVLTGWDMIGFTSTSDMAPESYLASVVGKYTMPYCWDNGGWLWWTNGNPASTFTNMEPTYGYWLLMTADGTISPP